MWLKKLFEKGEQLKITLSQIQWFGYLLRVYRYNTCARNVRRVTISIRQGFVPHKFLCCKDQIADLNFSQVRLPFNQTLVFRRESLYQVGTRYPTIFETILFNSIQSIRLILTREIQKKHANVAVILCENNFECIRTIAVLILKEELLKSLNCLTCFPPK